MQGGGDDLIKDFFFFSVLIRHTLQGFSLKFNNAGPKIKVPLIKA